MALDTLLWKLASPYDAYVCHVARLHHAMERINYFTEVAEGYEAGLQGSVRVGASSAPAEDRAARFRHQLADKAAHLTDEQFEEFLALLGGGEAATVESDRAQAASRRSQNTRGLEEYFAIAGHELALLEKRDYNPERPDVARQLRENRLPGTTLSEYRHTLRSLGTRAGRED
jgi:hypothetical protein